MRGMILYKSINVIRAVLCKFVCVELLLCYVFTICSNIKSYKKFLNATLIKFQISRAFFCPDSLYKVKGGFPVAPDIEEQYDKIYKYCYFKVHNVSLAEDITQETFLRYFAQNSYINRGKQLAYLYTIARNLCTDFYRKKKTEELKEEMADNPMEHVENNLYLQMAVEKLPEEMQELILLRYVNGLTGREISEITGLSRTAVYRREKEALKRLKKMLS